MKNLKFMSLITLGVMVGFNTIAQEQDPDQNPNYENSMNKYMEKSDELLQNQGETIQETYKAYDWTENKEEKKQERIDRRHEIRKMKYQSRFNRGYNPYYNNGYYNNGFNNNFNNPYMYNPYMYNPMLGNGLYLMF